MEGLAMMTSSLTIEVTTATATTVSDDERVSQSCQLTF
jgi:hypothetical protein